MSRKNSILVARISEEEDMALVGVRSCFLAQIQMAILNSSTPVIIPNFNGSWRK